MSNEFCATIKYLIDSPPYLYARSIDINRQKVLVYLYYIPSSEVSKCIIRGDCYEDMNELLPQLCYEFASDVLEGRFPEGEELISTSAANSFSYAIALGRRFELGEEVIKSSI